MTRKEEEIDAAPIQSSPRDADELLRVAVESSPSGILVVDAAGTIVLVNAEIEQIFGYPRSELIGESIELLVPAEARATHAVHVHTASGHSSRRGMGVGRDLRGRRRDGSEVPVEIGLKEIKAGGESFVLASVVDITERRSLQRQYLQAQKMEAIGRLAGGVAHDFNNLLTVISSYASLVLSESDLPVAVRDDISQIEKASAAAATLTRQLLAFSRQQVIQPVSLDLNEVVRDAQKILRRVIGEDVSLVAKLEGNLGRVLADFGQMEQVIMNMAVNARDAMPGGGQLTIGTSNVDFAEPFTRDGFAAGAGPYVMLTIRDTGSGISEETRLRIFEPFFTTKESGKGTGLGLSMVFGIVQQSGGCIAVESADGEGTIFRIYLPRVDTPSEPRAPVAVGEAPGGNETVLLVEDVSALRDVMRRVLTEKGYAVLDAVDGPAAIQRSRDHVGAIDLLLADVVLPGMSGHELARVLQPMRPGLKVLFTSGYTDDAVLRRGVFERDVAFLQKPFTPELLARRVREVLG